MMSLFDDNPPELNDSSLLAPADAPSVEPAAAPLAGDPITYAASSLPAASKPQLALPEDLRISWSWPHFVVFIFFTFVSFIVVQTALAVHYAPSQRLTAQQYEKYLLNKPQFVLGSSLICFALIFLFLYVTLAVLRDSPFWSSLGWRKWRPASSTGRRGPWIYFVSGFGLALFVALVGAQVHTKGDMPIEEMFKNRNSVFLLMGMAVLVAPLVEETVFRGYLYPLFAKSFGIVPGVLITGVLFGLMHGSQLGWNWGIVSLLIFVGVIFTSARAYTGTVFASFLLHLGYNSMIAVTTIVSTHGFTKIPISH